MTTDKQSQTPHIHQTEATSNSKMRILQLSAILVLYNIALLVKETKACKCMATHPQNEFCKNDFGKLQDKIMLGNFSRLHLLVDRLYLYIYSDYIASVQRGVFTGMLKHEHVSIRKLPYCLLSCSKSLSY